MSDPKNIEIVAEGERFVLPKSLEGQWDKAIDWLQKKKKEQESVVGFREEIKNAHPLDGLVAFAKALSKLYGWVDSRPSWFSSPPTMLGIWVSPTDLMQVPYGEFAVPGVDGTFETNFEVRPVPKFIISGHVKKKHLGAVHKIVETVHEILRADSIYRGKAIKVSYEWERQGMRFDPTTHCPQFLDLSKVHEEPLFDEDTTEALKIGLFGPMEYLDAMRANDIPLKKGVLLAGKYGVGKTLTALAAAKLAEEKGLTFIYLDSILDLPSGYEFAMNYCTPNGAVLFGEDIDRTMSGEERTPYVDNILNILDGIDTKGLEIITVLTTNHPEAINRALLRPGRINVTVKMHAPKAETVEKLIRKYGEGLLAPNIDLSAISRELEGNIPAVIKQVVENSKTSAIVRLGGRNIEGRVNEEDILAAYRMKQAYDSLLEEKHVGPKMRKLEVHLPPQGAFDEDGEAYATVALKEESQALN